MSDSNDFDTRPTKRVRLDSPSLSAPVHSAASTENTEAPTTTSTDATAPNAPAVSGETDLEREIRAGISEYVSPDNLGFTGVLKQRYTDFLVNEILPSGEVLHLRRVTASKKAPAQNGPKQDEGKARSEPIKAEDVPMEDIEVAKPATESAGKEKEETRTEDKPEELVVADADRESLESLLGVDTTSQVIALAQSIRKHPQRKAKDFTAVTGPSITDKEKRTSAHQTLRRIFSGALESAMEPDQSIRIKAAPPAERRNKRNGNKRERNPDSHRGQLAWDELGGEFLHFTLYKENKDTMEVVGFLGSVTKGGSKSFNFAGTKDRRACTVQRVCVKRQTAERMAAINRTLRMAAVGDFEYKSEDIRLGDLAGNEFTITLRDSHFEKEEGLNHEQRLKLANDVLTQAVKDFGEKGFISYYGLQRFGSFAASTDTIGIKLLQNNLEGAVKDLLAYSDEAIEAAQSTDPNPKVLVSKDDQLRAKGLFQWAKHRNGNAALNLIPRKFTAERNLVQHLSSKNRSTGKRDREQDWQGALMTIPRNLRLMYVHAYQSLVWNVVAGKRWNLFGDKVVEGDLVLVHEHRDKVNGAEPEQADTVDQDGEVIINPAGADSALKEDDAFERARPLSKAEAESGRYTIFDVVLPQPGFDVEYPKNTIGDFYKDFMASQRGGGLDPYNMRRGWREVSLSGGYRKFLARPLQPISFEIKQYSKPDEQLVETDLQRVQKQGGDLVPDGLEQNGKGRSIRFELDGEHMPEKEEQVEDKKIAVVMKLQLGSSQYATMALRELMKAGGVKAFKPEYMGGR